MAHAHAVARVETIEEKNQWLIDNPEEEAKYPAEWIAVADGRILAHGHVWSEVYDEARRLGFEPLMDLARDPEVEEF